MLICFKPFSSYTRQLPIDSSAYHKWPFLSSPAISNNGNYAMYTIEEGGNKTLVILSTTGKWKENITDVAFAEFTANNKFVVIARNTDSLLLLKLGTKEIISIPHVKSYKLGVQWMAYQQHDQLTVKNLENEKDEVFQHIKGYDWNGTALLLQVDKHGLQWLDLHTNEIASIWEGPEVSSITFDLQGEKLAFLTGDSIWVYNKGQQKAENKGQVKNIEGIRYFKGDRLIITLKEGEKKQPLTDPVRLNIWSYKDTCLQSEQIRATEEPSYEAVFNISMNKIVRVLNEGERFNRNENDDWSVIRKYNLVPGKLYQFQSAIVSTKDSTTLHVNYEQMSLSPSGRFAIYYDDKEQNFFTYELASGISRNITKNIKTTWQNDYTDNRMIRGEVAGWIREDEAVLIYDQFDVWQIDPAGINRPLNLTNGQGRKDSTLFYLALEQYRTKPLERTQEIILTAFNIKNKNNGFYSARCNTEKDPVRLTMGKWVYDLTANPEAMENSQFCPLKAKDAIAYIVQRQTANESPNYYFTKDFRHFKPLSNIRPELEYNWYTTELHSWQIPGGPVSQAILYKPQDFDSTRKYPVIFYYYQKLADNLNVYIRPKPSDGRLNIPWYVSNGYLVFAIDMHYELQKAGECILNSINSAAGYLTKMKYVDAGRMGIQGMSWGGYETNYILTHTNYFAATCSVSGAADLISYSGDLDGLGRSYQYMFESNSYYMTNTTLWENPAVYIKNSPIFNLDKVTTPLLMMGTTVDGAVSFRQAIELFTGLRRLGKKVWLLEYNDGEHGVWGKSALDFDIRMQQFFNYYLKDTPAPEWMTKGRPFKLKEADNRLLLDNAGVIP